jgi:glycosyltransferase involved in cell wall biosynthesis
MRIAFVTNNYTPYAAGVVKSIDAITHELRAQGHEVVIIAPQFLKIHDDPDYVIRIPSMFRFMYRQKHMALPWRAYSYLKKYLTAFNPDVVHVHHPFLLGVLASRVARQMGVPLFFTYHTIYEDYAHYVPLPSWLIKPLVTMNVLNFCRSVDYVISPSRGIKTYLNTKGISHTTIIPTPLRIEFADMPFVQKQLVQPCQLISVSRFVPEKNLLLLFDVLAQLPAHYHLTLVGYGSLEQALRKRAVLFPGRVQFLIDPSVERLLEAYQKAHLFLFASQTDTQGIVLAESMAAGTPVVALDGVGQRDIIEQGVNGFIVDDAFQMARTIERIMANPSLYNLLQQHAKGSVARYSPAYAIEQLLATYTMRAVSLK